MQTRYDLAIIGSGGGAFAAAIRATSLGKSVVMVERGTFGGTCVNTGCVPSKALIAAAEARHVAADAPTRFPGIASVAGAVDMPALIGGKQDLVEALRGEKYVDVADSYGWQVRRGNAAFAGTTGHGPSQASVRFGPIGWNAGSYGGPGIITHTEPTGEFDHATIDELNDHPGEPLWVDRTGPHPHLHIDAQNGTWIYKLTLENETRDGFIYPVYAAELVARPVATIQGGQ